MNILSKSCAFFFAFWVVAVNILSLIGILKLNAYNNYYNSIGEGIVIIILLFYVKTIEPERCKE